MAEKRKNRKNNKGRSSEPVVDEDKPGKLEYDVAKYLRSKLPEKRTTFMGHKVDYFIASQAINCLLESKWASKSDDQSPDAIFTTRESVVDFMHRMLVHRLFHRAQKVIIRADDGKGKKCKSKSDAESSAAEEAAGKTKGEVRERKNRDDSGSGVEGGRGDSGSSKNKSGEKKKKKVKLDMHQVQIFVDGSEPYVWIYEPTSLKAWFIGFALVIGGILLCLFPLWPRTVRNYVYYLSIAAAGFLLFIIGLAIIRFVIFTIVWAVTFGKHHFWILPNLTEDVGFFASFWPLYMYEYRGNNDSDGEDVASKESNDSKDATSQGKDQQDEPVEGEEENSKDDDAGEDAAAPVDEQTKKSL